MVLNIWILKLIQYIKISPKCIKTDFKKFNLIQCIYNKSSSKFDIKPSLWTMIFLTSVIKCTNFHKRKYSDITKHISMEKILYNKLKRYKPTKIDLKFEI